VYFKVNTATEKISLNMNILHLISGPRNISTALMYSFAQRSDTIVSDEPFYGVYLTKSGADHPGRHEVLQSQSNDEDIVFEQLFKPSDNRILFIKNMAHHVEMIRQTFLELEGVTNIFLIRNPAQIISSYAQVIDRPVMRDIGIQYQHELFATLRRQGSNPIVLDSNLLLDNPASVLRQLCDLVEIPFEDAMLNWERGPKPYDGVWAKYWYHNVHQSTGFQKQTSSNRALPDHLVSLHEQAVSFYNKLLPYAIQP
jgi:hypothetical protein